MRGTRGFRLSLALGIALLSASTAARADGIFDFNLIDPANLNGALPQGVADEAIRMVGIYTAHRPYTGATPITRYNGVDFNIEATLVKIGPGLVNALRDAGATSLAPDAAPALPVAKLNLRKGIGPNSDIGLSGLVLYGQTIVGGDIRWLVSEPEEGLNWAIRLGYTYADIPTYAYVRSCNTIAPEVVVSRPLEFAEPYVGVGGRYMWGTVDIPFEGAPPLVPDFNITKKGKASDLYVFTGVYFHIIGPQGLRLGVEGAWDLSGYHTIGTVFGVGF